MMILIIVGITPRYIINYSYNDDTYYNYNNNIYNN